MTLLIVSFIAGMLTVLAPCILPVLPVILGGSLAGEASANKVARPLTIVVSLATSIIVFSLVLKASTALLGVPTAVWSTISGLIVIALGIVMIFPDLWENLVTKLGLSSGANRLLAGTSNKRGRAKDVLTGLALGPVFSSCSPTYALIVAVVIPQSFARGLTYLVAYAAGLALMLLIITLASQQVIGKMAGLSRPSGVLNRVLGIIFIVVGLGVIFGVDKQLQTLILENGWYAPLSQFEDSLK